MIQPEDNRVVQMTGQCSNHCRSIRCTSVHQALSLTSHAVSSRSTTFGNLWLRLASMKKDCAVQRRFLKHRRSLLYPSGIRSRQLGLGQNSPSILLVSLGTYSRKSIFVRVRKKVCLVDGLKYLVPHKQLDRRDGSGFQSERCGTRIDA